MFILILNPHHRNPYLWVDSNGFVETFTTAEEAERVGDEQIESGFCKEYKIYQEQ